MNAHTILVIEDDHAIRRGVVDALRFSGYEVLEAGEGKAGMDLALSANFDLLLLDLVLPNFSGFEILAALKEHRAGTPVIILSARGEEADRVKGLKLGADDYVVKPFSVRELMARVEAVLRRTPERPAPVKELPFDGGVADFARLELRFVDGSRTELSEREAQLIVNTLPPTVAGRLRGMKFCVVSGTSNPSILRRAPSTCTLPTFVPSCATMLAAPRILLTVRGKGYMLAERRQKVGSQN